MIKYDVSLPRLLNASGGTAQWLHPVKVSVNLSITPLSYASMELPVGEYLPARGYVEIFTSMGSAGVFRVQSPQDAYGNDQTSAELEHAIVEVGDWCVLQKYDEMMAASTAMTTIFSHYRGSKWKLGNVSALGTQQIAVNADHDRVLEAMLALLDQVPDCMLTFDFSTSPWTVAVAKRGTTVAAEGRLGRNISSAKVIYDDTELCTRAYYDVTDYSDISDIDESSDATTTWYTLEADTIGKWGIVERDVNVGSGATLDEAKRVAQEYIQKHKEPRISISISAQDLSRITGEPWDTFAIGKLFRLSLPEYGTTVEQVITGLDWEDVYGAPEAFTVSLAYEEDTAVNFIHDIDAKGGSGGGGGGGRKKAKEWKEYWTDFKQTDKFIEMTAAHVDTNDKILQQAGLYLDSDGVLIYSRDNENMWSSHLQVQADRIGLVVEGQGENAKIRAAEITASINDSGSQVHINADKIIIGDDIDGIDKDYKGKTLDGTLTAITTDFTTVNTLLAKKIEAKDITTDMIASKIADIAIVKYKALNGGSINATGVTVTGNSLSVNGKAMMVSNITVSGDTMTITKTSGSTITFKKGDTDAAYNEGWNDCIDAAKKVSLYTRSTNSGNGGASVVHYLRDGSSYSGIGAGWYKTTLRYAYDLPAKK